MTYPGRISRGLFKFTCKVGYVLGLKINIVYKYGSHMDITLNFPTNKYSWKVLSIFKIYISYL